MSIDQFKNPEELSSTTQLDDESEALRKIADGLMEMGVDQTLSSLMEKLIAMNDRDSDQQVLGEVTAALEKHKQLDPSVAPLIDEAIRIVSSNFESKDPNEFTTREAFLTDLNSNPKKYFRMENSTLIITQPGNTAKFSRIHDFIGKDSQVFPLKDADNFSLSMAGTDYTWSNAQGSWLDTNGKRLLLKNSEERISLTEKAPSTELSRNEVYDVVWEAIQPQKDAEGTLRGGFVQIRNHLYTLPNSTKPDPNRPDPLPRTYYYYGKQFPLNPDALGYTGHDKDWHDNIAQILRAGFVTPAPTAGGGIPTMIEAGEEVLNQHAYLEPKEKSSILDQSYQSVLEMSGQYLNVYGADQSRELLGPVVSSKARFDAQISSFLLRVKKLSGSASSAIKEDLYGVHVGKSLEAAAQYLKLLNKTPREFRNSFVVKDIIPQLKSMVAVIPDDQLTAKKNINIYIKQFGDSVTQANA